MNIIRLLEKRIAHAFVELGIPGEFAPNVRESSRPEFGDYQADGIIQAARQLKTNPRELAEKVLAHLDLSDIAEAVSIAGQGFMNIILQKDLLARLTAEAECDERLGIAPTTHPETVVVDYSGPNLAKEMHVGHLRSSIIGDAVARISEFMGHRVIRQNHVGDYGTQFGMLIAAMDDASVSTNEAASLSDLESFYIKAKKRDNSDPYFHARARELVLKLQHGDAHCVERWTSYIDVSLAHCRQVYERLGLSLRSEDMRSESSYRDDCPRIITDLESASLLVESDGARCVFLDGFKGRDGAPFPFIVQKTDGAYLYATFDLAAMNYRRVKLGAKRILYVHDVRQTLHFRQAFTVARAAGFVTESMILEHVAFGTMLGEDGKPFKTRDGGTVKLLDLLDEAEKRALKLVGAKNPALSATRQREIARTVGIGSVKYADLSMSRTTDYIFSWDKMLSLNGNTAPYLQYAYARIASIFRKAGAMTDNGDAVVKVTDPSERVLMLKLLQFEYVLDMVTASSSPHLLCTWLYEVAGAFMKFYESCPVLQAPPDVKASRLRVCRLTASTIRQALELLGIQVVEEM